MKKLSLVMIGLYVGLFAGFAQSKADSSKYKNHKLSFEEANIVSSYYSQDGNNSAVTGGIGTEKLTDLSNSFELKLYKYDKRYRKNSFNFELGIDHYTSASSDMVDLKANSSASYNDTRIYPSINWTRENEKKGTTIGTGLSYSHEFDYISYGGNINFAAKTKNRSGEFSAKFQTFLDQVSLIQPLEIRTLIPTPGRRDDRSIYPTSPRNTFDLALSYSQIINQHFQIMLMGDIIAQNGYLGLPFHRVYLSTGKVVQENLPNNRVKIPLGIRANYFLGDNLILRGYYRFYTDDWGITAHTASLETPIKINSFFSVSPFYRYYTQTATKYFAPYQQTVPTAQYYTSNYDLSNFNSSFYGAGIRLTPPKGVFGVQHFEMLEIRYGHYSKSYGMQSDIVSINMRFK
jgi:hypothetical protein